MDVCEGCGLESVSFDFNAGVLVCEGCGLVRQETEFRHGGFDEEGTKTGVYVSGRGTAASLGLGRSTWGLAPGAHSVFRSDYKKKYAVAKLEQLSSVLRLPKDKSDDVKHMLAVITEERYGSCRWMDVLIGTCIYIIARQHRLPLSAAEIANHLNCPIKELLCSYQRVIEFMGISCTPFDSGVYFDKVLSHYPAFMSMGRDEVRKLSKQGRCLLQYGAEWSLADGRHPLAIVAAVAVIVGRANNIKVDLKLVSQDLHVHPQTSRLRLNEFMDALVGFGQRLPWGKDITLTTLGRHLPFLLQYLETRVKMDSSHAAEISTVTMDSSSNEDVTLRHIAKVLYNKFGPSIRAVLDGQVLDVVKDESDVTLLEDSNEIKKRKVDSSAVECSRKEAKLSSENTKEEGKTGFNHCCTWKPLPPAFLANVSAEARRAARIEAAKERIASVKQDMANLLMKKRGQECVSSAPSKKIGAQHEKPLDEEDLLIQYCLIRGADEKVLQAGYYSHALSTPPVQPDKDITSDNELLQYFKTPKEIAFLESLSNEEPVNPWLNNDELEGDCLFEFPKWKGFEA